MSKAEGSRKPDPKLWDQSTFAVQEIETDRLDLDTRNPRLTRELGADASPDRVVAKLWQSYALDELALSICSNGFWRNEPLYAVGAGGRYTVIEGNRRLATVKLLLDEDLRNQLKANDLPKAPREVIETLRTLPVVVYPSRELAWPLLGFRHINGPVRWDPWAKARYIQQVHELHSVPLEEIAKRIGDQNATVFRLYQGLIVADQAQKAGYELSDMAAPKMALSHLYTGLRYPGFQKHLGLKPSKEIVRVPRSHYKELVEVMTWLFGSKSRSQLALIKSQNPDLKNLDDVIQTPRGLSALRAGLGLDRATEISKGDDARFLDAVTQARYSIQQARGLAQDGYGGDEQTLDEVRSIETIAKLLVAEMADLQPSARKRRARRSE